MPAAGTFQTEIRADPQDLPLMAAARVWLFEFYNISEGEAYIEFPLSPVTTLYSDRVPQHLPDAVADNQIRLAIARGR